MHIDHDAILAMLPHRDPILLVESASISQPGLSGRALARLPGKAMLLGDLSGHDVTGELVLEAAAQSVGLVLGSGQSAGGGADARHLLLGFDSVQFGARGASTGEPLDIDVDVHEAGSAACNASFRVTQHGRAVAHGRVMVMKGPA